MTLDTQDRGRVRKGLARYWSASWTQIPVSKTGLLDAVVATDNWIESGQNNYNNALPEPAKSALTAEQKTLLFCAVALARVDILTLRRVLGEVD